MSDIIHQIQDISTLSFEDAKNIFGWSAIAAGVAIPASLIGVDYFRNPKTSEDALVGDIEIAELTVEAAGNEGKLKSKWNRWGKWAVMGTGVSIMAVQALGPHLEYETTVPDSEFIHIIDASESMQLTSDIDGDLTRFVSISDSLVAASETFPIDARAGIILFGENVELTTPLTTDRTALKAGLVTDQISANGGDLEGALALGLDILAGSDNAGNDVLVLSTDGTIQNREAAMAKMTQIAEAGTEILVVMPGTADGNFVRTEFDINTTPSGVDTSGFESIDEQFDNVSVITTNNAAEIQKIIEEQTAKQTQETSKRSTDLFWYLGGAVTALGVAVGIRKDWKRN